MTENNVYLKALGVLNDALDGKTVNPVALRTAETMFISLSPAIYQERLKREDIKQAMRETFAEFIEEKDDKREN